MKIGIDARLLAQTGVGRYTTNLISNLSAIDKKNDYVLFVRNQDADVFKKLKVINEKWKIVRVDIKWHSIEEQIKFLRILNREKLDLVHFPYFSIPIFYKRPFVVTIHDLILHHFPTGKASMLPTPVYWSKISAYKFVISQAAKKAKKVISVSSSTKKEIIDHLSVSPQKIEVIYEAADDKIGNSGPEARDKNKFGKYFLFVGNVYPHKNAETLIRAFEELNGNSLSLIFVGKNDYFYDRLKKKVKGNTNIKFLHEVSDDELGNIYRNAQATICPAFMEGFGLPALEAMANKCLVIASDTPALREVCQDNAIYFNPKDPQELAEKMKEVLGSNKKFESLIEKGYKRSQEFSWRKMSEETLSIYNSVI
jgi:glycosyltransferase involved in cell wall biosynthesis